MAATEQGTHTRGTAALTRQVFIYGTTAATNAILTGRTARTAFLTTEGLRDTLVLREGGKLHPFDFRHALPGAVRPAAADVRGPRADHARRARCSCPWTSSAVRATLTRRARARTRGGRRVAAVVDRQPRHEEVGRRAARGGAPGCPVHALPPAQPDHPGVPARLVDGHRRLAEAADAATPRRDGGTICAQPGSRASCSSAPRSAAS